HHIDKTDIDKHISDFQRQNGFELSTQQKEAIYHITERTGRVSTINGSAGAGKSTSMAVVREAYEAKGFKVIGCALAGKAAAELADSAGLKESLTIDRLLIELENGKRQFDDKTIILMDEGGMVGSRHARDLLKHANNAASIENKTIHTVLLGDVEQLKPVSAGPAFKTAQAVLRDQGQDTAILDEIRRQKSSYARDAVHDFTAGRAAEGLAEYHQRGQVKFYDAGDKAKVEDHKFEAVKGMVDTWKSDLAETKLTDIQMLVSTRKEAYQANYIAHTIMQKDGQIDGVNHTIDTPEGQRDFAIGDRIIFKKNDKNTQVNNGWTGTITDIRPNKDGELTITADVDGQGERTFSTADYKNIDWSYAITTHASQGITKDHTHVLASSDPNAMTDLSLFMVQMSRHKQSSTIHIAHETVREIYQEAEPTPEMVSRAEEQSAQQTPPEAKHDFGHFRRWISKMFSELTQRFQREQERQIETLSMLAELAQRDRQKDSTLDNFNDQQATKKTFAEDDPRSKLTAKERIKIAMSVNYDRDFSEADRQGELPKFDRHESKAIDRIAGQKHAESISTDNPLDKRDAWKQAAQEWMSMRSQDRRELLRQDAAQNYVNRQGNQATNRNTLKV
ncbi:MAG: AAA family ATPase, partial [gamma proteobacterium symbiont of Clathrolucina costata]